MMMCFFIFAWDCFIFQLSPKSIYERLLLLNLWLAVCDRAYSSDSLTYFLGK